MSENHRPGQSSGRNSSETPLTGEGKRLIVIAAIPCFNEERFIGSVVLKTKNYVDHVMVIDDGSADKTALVAEQAGATVIRHDSNLGKGVAIKTAFKLAEEMGCEALVLLDGDGQHDTADIPLLLKPVLEGQADMVIGSRFLDLKSNIPGYRVWGQKLLTFFTNLGSQVSTTDSQSGFRAFSPKAIRTMSFAEKGLSVESEMQFQAKQANIRIVEVPVNIGYYDKARRSPLSHGLVVLNGLARLIMRRIPLFFFGVPGLLMLVFAVWQGVQLIQDYEATGNFYIGPAMLTVMFGIMGMLSLFTAIILHSIKSLFK